MPAPCACGIDVHAHVVPEQFPSCLGSSVPPLWPATAAAPDAGGPCRRHIMIAVKNYRTVSEKCWIVSRRLGDLPQMGLSRQVISPMPQLLSCWFQPDQAQQLLRFLSEQIAAMAAESAGALIGMAAVPLQLPAAMRRSCLGLPEAAA